MEVEDRLARLQEQLSTPQPQPEPHNKKYADRYAETHRRVRINGVSKWYDISELEKIPTPNSKTGYKWVLKGTKVVDSGTGEVVEAKDD